MKKIYLALFMAFMGGQLMAQSMTTGSSSSNSKENQGTSSNAVTNEVNPNLPGFPVYQNTGNTELDNKNYADAKKNWIEQNQELYNNYIASLSATPIVDEFPVVDAPDFPQYVNTGNKELDDINYINAKKKWYKNNKK